jgi:cytochrome b subunit of formate dehydrogenase
MKNFWITLVSILILLISGIVIGWFWCKSRIKPIIIEKPGETVTIT